MGGAYGGERTHVLIYVWLNPFPVHLKLSQHCQLAVPPEENKKVKKFKTEISVIIYLHLMDEHVGSWEYNLS